jgi:hypothetical protein
VTCWQDKLDTIRLLVIGVSAHQKLELLERLVTQLGYDSLTVFGDCFDEVGGWAVGAINIFCHTQLPSTLSVASPAGQKGFGG